MSGKPFKPEIGKVYENRGGGFFECVFEPYEANSKICAEMQNIKSGWRFIAKGVIQYADGTIEWDRSVGGYFAKKEGGA